jgi:hypothetical protein
MPPSPDLEAATERAARAAERAFRDSLERSLNPAPNTANYSSFAPLGIPLFKIDIAAFIRRLRIVYRRMADDNDAEAVRMLLERHEQLISRCALLLGFASILVAIVVFLAPDVPALPWVWERDLFYLSIFYSACVTKCRRRGNLAALDTLILLRDFMCGGFGSTTPRSLLRS